MHFYQLSNMFALRISTCVVLLLHCLEVYTGGVDSECSFPQDCGLWHFVCEDGFCKCDKEHVPSDNKTICMVEIGKPCGYHDPCYDHNAECQDVRIPVYGHCGCKKGFSLHPVKKVCAVVLGNNCTAEDTCIDGSCNNNKCSCTSTLEPNSNKTTCLPGLEADCKGFNRCAQDNAACDGSKCHCNQGYQKVVVNNTNYCLAELDVVCKMDFDCADPNAFCDLANNTAPVCHCKGGFVQNPDGLECLEVASYLGFPCKADVQCQRFSGIGSKCVNKKCDCRDSYYFDEDQDRCVRSCLCKGLEDKIAQLTKRVDALEKTVSKIQK